MTATFLTQNTFAFADGNAGHVCNLGSAPAVGDLDILCVNSNTVVATPSGFLAGTTAVANQGSYIFYRFAVGGEGSTVTITTTGNHNTAVQWSRWDDCIAVDDAATPTQVNGVAGNSTPAHSTGVLAETDELVIAFGALHSISVADQNTPVWSAGYTALNTAGPMGTVGSGVIGFAGYRTDAGTAAETPQVSWSGAVAEDRYMLTLTFTSEPDVPQLVGVSAVTVGATGDLLTVSVLDGASDVVIGATGTLSGSVQNSATFISQLSAALLNCLCAAVSGNPDPPDHCCYRVGTEPVHDIDLETQVDLCCEGLAYVLLRDVYPSSESFPENDIVRQIQGSCAWPAWAIGFRIGIVRCAPTVSDCDVNNEAFIQNIYDVQSINETVCCFREFIRTSELFAGYNLVIERQVQGSTSGGCTERYVNLVAQIPNLDCTCG
jgi:hypothetical protein